MFKITQEWIQRFASEKGGWNKPQLAAIGVEWPPPQGWRIRVSGTEITDEKRIEFERLQGQSQQAIKVARGRANMATNPVYRTFPDGKGGWDCAWMGDARFPWSK